MSDLLRATSAFVFILAVATSTVAADRVRIDSGTLEGTKSADGKVQVFKGIPYAAPPVGELRWKEPQPVKLWGRSA
jgi:para-nitrobenzyl esterase